MTTAHPPVDGADCVLLLSGGMDSAALAHWVRPAATLYIDYGQRPADSEERAATAIANALGISIDILRIDLSVLGAGLLLAETPTEFKVEAPAEGSAKSEAEGRSGSAAEAVSPSPEWWPLRNQLLCSLAAAWALSPRAPSGTPIRKVLTATVAGDGSRHVDGTTAFYEAMDAVTAMQEGNIRVLAPAAGLSAAELLRALRDHRGPPRLDALVPSRRRALRRVPRMLETIRRAHGGRHARARVGRPAGRRWLTRTLQWHRRADRRVWLPPSLSRWSWQRTSRSTTRRNLPLGRRSPDLLPATTRSTTSCDAKRPNCQAGRWRRSSMNDAAPAPCRPSACTSSSRCSRGLIECRTSTVLATVATARPCGRHGPCRRPVPEHPFELLVSAAAVDGSKRADTYSIRTVCMPRLAPAWMHYASEVEAAAMRAARASAPAPATVVLVATLTVSPTGTARR